MGEKKQTGNMKSAHGLTWQQKKQGHSQDKSRKCRENGEQMAWDASKTHPGSLDAHGRTRGQSCFLIRPNTLRKSSGRASKCRQCVPRVTPRYLDCCIS